MLPSGRLSVDRVAPHSVVSHLYAEPPLRLLVPRNHGDGVWCFTSHLGGGFVDGDRVSLDVTVAPSATALLGTQASTKVYRGSASQEIRAQVGAGGFLAVVPDPVVCFRDARYQQRLDVDLAADADCILIDAFTSGRPAHGERWAFQHFRSETRVRRSGALLVHDAVEIDATHGDLARRMGRFDAFATLTLVGHAAEAPGTSALRPLARDEDLLEQEARVAGDVLVIRLAATRVETLTTAIRAHLGAQLAARLGDDPFARKF